MSSVFDTQQRRLWDSQANLRPHTYPVIQGFISQRATLIKELMGQSLVESALDVGCGDGWGMLALREIAGKVCGCDRSQEMLRGNPQREDLCLADAYHLPYRNASFDLVSCWELLHHVERPGEVIRDMARVSRKHVLIFEPNSLNSPMALFGLATSSERGLLRFTPWYLKGMVTQAGLYLERALPVGTFTPNRTPTWIFRLLRRLPYKWLLFGVSNVALARVAE
ncbi:class I SAM-dependent methyltransferase [Chloroflexota bacterium]